MGLATKKISISLSDELDRATRLAEEAILQDGRAAINEEISEHGPFAVTADEGAWINAVLADGVALRTGRDHALDGRRATQELS